MSLHRIQVRLARIGEKYLSTSLSLAAIFFVLPTLLAASEFDKTGTESDGTYKRFALEITASPSSAQFIAISCDQPIAAFIRLEVNGAVVPTRLHEVKPAADKPTASSSLIIETATVIQSGEARIIVLARAVQPDIRVGFASAPGENYEWRVPIVREAAK